MRLAMVLLIVAIMQVSAASYGQKITINERNVPIEKIFESIRDQIGYDFFFDRNVTGKMDKVTVNVDNADLKKVLDACFNGTALTYKIEQNTVMIKERESSILDTFRESIQTDSLNYVGIVLDVNGNALAGATIKIKGAKKYTTSASNGIFVIYGPRQGTMEISYLGYKTNIFILKGQRSTSDQLLTIFMIPEIKGLNEVQVIVSTGYQDLSKERATGSFEMISAKQLEHSTDPNLLKRLEGLTTSMDFKNALRPTNSALKTNIPLLRTSLGDLTIRGQNTLNADRTGNMSGWPLVVIDGIASPYSIDLVNPDDVESITILKDAASASIWGSRAANGVIVVKTKKAELSRPLRVNFRSTLNVTEKMDLFYQRQMSVSDYIDAETYAFNQLQDPNNPNNPDYYLPDPVLSSPQSAISPVSEILLRQKKGLITADQASSQLNALRNNDIRNDYTKYFLRNGTTQTYSLSLDGGSKEIANKLSLGYSKIADNTIASGSNRLNMGYNVILKPFKALTLETGISYSRELLFSQASATRVDASNSGNPFYPYTSLADDQGNPLEVAKGFRPAYLDLLEQTYGNKILSLRWKPLQDINEGYNHNRTQNVNLNLSGLYKLNDVLSANITYNYNKGLMNSEELNKAGSWYMRDMIDRYTDPSTFARAVPYGGLYSISGTESDNQTLRGLININKTFGLKHNFSGIAGIDITDAVSRYNSNAYYGYDEQTLKSNNQLNFNSQYNLLYPYFFSTTGTIPYIPEQLRETRVRTVGLFANATYMYAKRYTISASVRGDGSSEFGSATNRSGSPYYSAGVAWNLSDESFYKLAWLPMLKARATFGYNGNVNARITANPAITYSTSLSPSRLPYATPSLSFITNSKLRPERTGILNLGLDFATKGSRLSGSFEYYRKNTSDLLYSNPVDPNTGFTTP